MKKDNNTKYAKVYDDIVLKINNKTYLQDEPLPNTKELCEIYQVSHTTISEAMKHLQHDNIVERFNGKGTFIKQKLATNNSFHMIINESFANHYYHLFSHISATLAQNNIPAHFICTHQNEMIEKSLLDNLMANPSNIIFIKPIQTTKLSNKLINTMTSNNNIYFLDNPLDFLELPAYTTDISQVFNFLENYQSCKILYITYNIKTNSILSSLYDQLNLLRAENIKMSISINICNDIADLQNIDYSKYDLIISSHSSIANSIKTNNLYHIFEDQKASYSKEIHLFNYKKIADEIIKLLQNSL